MPLRTQAVGGTTRALRTEMSTRRLQAYAAGLTDRNPMYFDDARPDGIVAPPAICVSLEWPVNLELRSLPGYGVTPDEALRGVHALQDSTFHRPIRPGDALLTQATLVQARRIPPGAFSLVRFDTRDAETGEPVVTSYSGGILRGVAVEGEDRAIDAPPGPAASRTRAGLPAGEKVTLSVSPELAHVYTECADIWNPIHTERRVARAAGLPDIILHGTASWALCARELCDRVAGGDPRGLERLAGRFRAMVALGTTLTLHFAVEPGGRRVDFELRNQAGEPAIADGLALFAPSSP